MHVFLYMCMNTHFSSYSIGSTTWKQGLASLAPRVNFTIQGKDWGGSQLIFSAFLCARCYDVCSCYCDFRFIFLIPKEYSRVCINKSLFLCKWTWYLNRGFFVPYLRKWLCMKQENPYLYYLISMDKTSLLMSWNLKGKKQLNPATDER
jgi:hypothetical protein